MVKMGRFLNTNPPGKKKKKKKKTKKKKKNKNKNNEYRKRGEVRRDGGEIMSRLCPHQKRGGGRTEFEDSRSTSEKRKS